jgi:hypothetical protein
VKIDGQSYEFLDNAYEKYKKLQGEKEILTLRLEAISIESPSTKIPVILAELGQRLMISYLDII